MVLRLAKEMFWYSAPATNGKQYKREWLLHSSSRGSVYCFLCKLYAPKFSLRFVERQGFRAIIRMLAECSLAFRGTNEKFGSLKNENILGLSEHISQFDSFL
ncbi:uncharacterized protein LOC143254448 [Tachypleus tridentatus]|uniref:uncharacterized protein LOC143254448 n=1 Tax=Tachypleus tridentatus TaxID=6853 RepID=UPI003FD265E8